MNEKTVASKIIGRDLVKLIAKNLPNSPGIYKMMDIKSNIIYVGKAKNLKNRVQSYALTNLGARTLFMVSNIANIQYTETPTELDALILESDLIKHYKPLYNIALKDDKTYPFIKIDTTHSFPSIAKFRSKKGSPNKGIYGPFASSLDIKEYIKLVQRLFQIRNCTDSFFSNRKQPCILHQIKRCSAPCVRRISEHNYKESLNNAMQFLEGNNVALKNSLAKQMNDASLTNNYEAAIVFRERIKMINNMSAKQSFILPNDINADFISIVKQSYNNESNIAQQKYLVKIFIFRNGHNYGSLDIEPTSSLENSNLEVLQSVIPQFYKTREVPPLIYVSEKITSEVSEDFKLIEDFLFNINKQKTKIRNPSKDYTNMMEIILKNATLQLERSISDEYKWRDNFFELQNLFTIENKITRIEIYDNSHLYGNFSLGVMVCALESGFSKENYKVFNLKSTSIKSNDDYGILYEVLKRRFSKIGEDNKPTLVLIDGGRGQLSVALNVRDELNITNIKFVAIAKGINRNAGDEVLFVDNDSNNPIKLNKFSKTLHFIQMLRNEAHRYAIKNVRNRSTKFVTKSTLDSIDGIGKIRKKLLLEYFTSIDKIKVASVEDLQKVKGINKQTALKIFQWFNS